jgi:hypothetical protein
MEIIEPHREGKIMWPYQRERIFTYDNLASFTKGNVEWSDE